MPMRTVHCHLCGKAIRGYDFAERMKKLRHHRKQKHPSAHKRSVAKAMVTKGYDREWKRKAKLDPSLKIRRGLIQKPQVIDHYDLNASGLVRVLRRKDGTNFAEFALCPKRTNKAWQRGMKSSLINAGLKEEAKDKWVLRTNKFSIFVYA